MAAPSEDDKRPDPTPFDADPANPETEAAGDGAAQTGTLDLQDIDERLPWLESDDDAAQDSGEGGRVAGFLLGGLVALAAIVGGIWWISHRSEPEIVADGGVIEAPEQAYKEAPENPGGKTFAGTGDSSFAVSEGQTRAARLGQDARAPAAAPSAAPKPSASASAQPQGIGVQVGAYSSKASAEAGWTRLQQQHEALSGVAHRVVEGRADIGTVYRLQAVPGDLAAANALCGKLKTSGVACQVKR